MPRDSYM